MTIDEILQLPTNADVGGVFTVKTSKKIWKESDGHMQQVLLCDKTGEMLADVHIIDYQPIQRGVQIELIQAITQHGENGIRLYVEEMKYAGEPISEPPLQGEIPSKIKCRHSEAFMVKYGTGKDENGMNVIDFLESKLMKDIIVKVMR